MPQRRGCFAPALRLQTHRSELYSSRIIETFYTTAGLSFENGEDTV